MQFLSGGYFAFLGYPSKKCIVPIDPAHFPGSETTKIWKSPKSNLHINSATPTISFLLISTLHILYLDQGVAISNLPSPTLKKNKNSPLPVTEALIWTDHWKKSGVTLPWGLLSAYSPFWICLPFSQAVRRCHFYSSKLTSVSEAGQSLSCLHSHLHQQVFAQ